MTIVIIAIGNDVLEGSSKSRCTLLQYLKCLKSSYFPKNKLIGMGLLFFCPLIGMGQNTAIKNEEPIRDVTFDAKGIIVANNNFNLSNGNNNFNLGKSHILLTGQWEDKIVFALGLKLAELIKAGSYDDLEFNDDFEVEEFVRDAYIKIENFAGTPVAIIVGKHQIAFGQNWKEMPIPYNNPITKNIMEREEIFGLTFSLDKDILGIIDQAEFSIFETDAGDMSINNINGLSLRLGKQITEGARLTLSHSYSANNVEADMFDKNSNHKTALGVVLKSKTGKLRFWIEALNLYNEDNLKSRHFGGTAGVAVDVNNRGTTLIAESTYLNKEQWQISAGIRQNLTSTLSIGIEGRSGKFNKGETHENYIGIALSKKIGSTPPNNKTLFGPKSFPKTEELENKHLSPKKEKSSIVRFFKRLFGKNDCNPSK